MSEAQLNALPVETQDARFVDRRSYEHGTASPVRERRQFCNSHEGLSPEVQELASAIDKYKLVHRRRFITYEEMLSVIQSLGYHK
jgi:hypothetical protein